MEAGAGQCSTPVVVYPNCAGFDIYIVQRLHNGSVYAGIEQGGGERSRPPVLDCLAYVSLTLATRVVRHGPSAVD